MKNIQAIKTRSTFYNKNSTYKNHSHMKTIQ